MASAAYHRARRADETPEARERRLAQQRDRYQRTKPACQAKAREYQRQKNAALTPDELEARKLEGRREYAEKISDPVWKKAKRDAVRRWRERNPGLANQRTAACKRKKPWLATEHENRRRAQKRGTTAHPSDPRIVAIYVIAHWLRSMGDDVHVDHVQPLSKGGGHVYENLQILTATENMKKGAKVDQNRTESFQR